MENDILFAASLCHREMWPHCPLWFNKAHEDDSTHAVRCRRNSQSPFQLLHSQGNGFLSWWLSRRWELNSKGVESWALWIDFCVSVCIRTLCLWCYLPMINVLGITGVSSNSSVLTHTTIIQGRYCPHFTEEIGPESLTHISNATEQSKWQT